MCVEGTRGGVLVRAKTTGAVYPDPEEHAEKYGKRGRSYFTTPHPYKTYASRRGVCYWDSGEGFSPRALEGAIRHQRRHHFYH